MRGRLINILISVGEQLKTCNNKGYAVKPILGFDNRRYRN